MRRASPCPILASLADKIVSACRGEWEKAAFKKYNFEAEGAPTFGGALHPLMKVREEFRNIFFETGCANRICTLSRELRLTRSRAQLYRDADEPLRRVVLLELRLAVCASAAPGTRAAGHFLRQGCAAWSSHASWPGPRPDPRLLPFPLTEPSASTGYPQDYYERVKRVHEVGDYGSTGYRYPFSKEETSRLVLRTHTTSVSAAMLYELANQPGGFKPAKMFSIDRVFRNEAVDMTHLAEFHQVEGVVADRNLTLADLIGASQSSRTSDGEALC